MKEEIKKETVQVKRPKSCSNCLWYGFECKNREMYKPVKQKKKSDIDCEGWTYYD